MRLDEMANCEFKENRAMKNFKDLSTKDAPNSKDGKRDYHYPSGEGSVNPTPKKRDPNMTKDYHYPSGEGAVSPIVGKNLPGRTARRA